MRAALVTALTALTAACGTTADPGPFTINYTLNTATGGCASSECSSFGMSCGAVLSIRITDPATGELIVAGSQEAALCETISPSANLCGLANLPPGSIFFDLPPTMLRIEVAAWSADTLAAAGLGSECPSGEMFDLAGQPLASFSPQPAFAGAVYFDAGSSATEALVPLSCSDPLQLDTLDCAPEQIQVHAAVVDLESPPTQTSPSPLPNSLLVRIAAVRQVQIDEDQFTEIDSQKPIPILDREIDGSFSAALDESEVPNPLCVVVLEQTPQATTSVTCRNHPATRLVEATGALLLKSNLDEILAALELDAFPPEGLIIGRVFDQGGTPIAGVTVTPNVNPALDPDPVVEYLNSSRDDTLPTQTFDNGYFIARGVSFGTEWSVGGVVGKVPVAIPSAGLVRNQLTLLPIEMRDEIKQ